MRRARAAREQLKNATSDKGGHRGNAIDLTDKAIAQVEKGIAYDNNHKGDKKDVTGTKDAAETLVDLATP